MLFRIKALLLIGLITLSFALAAQDGPARRYGLFVGANDGGFERVMLRWAVSDAHRMAEVMNEAGGIRPRDTYVMSDPRSSDLQRQFRHLSSRIASDSGDSRRSELIFYYSGHSDETGIMLGEDHMTYRELRDAIDNVEADVTIAIIDSCASGAFTRLKGGSFSEPFAIDDGSELTGHAFLTSSSADEASQESDALGSSFFTHYLVSGLRGAADSSDDQIVTLDEVYLYAREQTLQRTINSLAGPQNASFDFQLSGTGSLVLTNLAVVDSGIVLDTSVEGVLYVSEQRGRIVAEVEKQSGSPMRLALPAGNYSLTLQGEGRNYVHDVTLSSGSFSTVAGRDFRVAFLDRNRVRGSQQAAVPASITVFPGQNLLNPSSPLLVNFSGGILVGDALSVEGGQLSSVISQTHGDLSGAQLAGVGNQVGGNLTGVQLSPIYNTVEGNAFGVQMSGVLNRADGEAGFWQHSGVVNLAGASFNGVQTAGVVSIVGGPMVGAQISGVYNKSAGLTGAQIGLVNIGGDVTGAQIGLVNIGGRVTGTQIGLVNISDSVHGVPLGLINIVDDGIHDVSIWWEGDQKTWFGLQNGSDLLYTIGYLGWTRGGELAALDGLSVGAALGLRITNRPFYIDVDLGWKRVTEGTDAQQRFASLFQADRGATFPSARVIAGIAIGEGLGWFVGGSFDLNGPFSSDNTGYFAASSDSAFSIDLGGGPVSVHPVFVTGFKL